MKCTAKRRWFEAGESVGEDVEGGLVGEANGMIVSHPFRGSPLSQRETPASRSLRLAGREASLRLVGTVANDRITSQQ